MHEILRFIAGDFEHINIPPEKKYLLKYFRTDLQQNFLKYYLNFGSTKYFSEHTGVKCGVKNIEKWEKRLKEITEKYDQLKAEFTEESLFELNEIESGNYRFEDSQN